MTAIEPLQPEDLADAVARLLAAPGSGRVAGRSQVRGFIEHTESCRIRWEGFRCGPRGAPAGVFLALLLPGSTAIVMVPTPGELGIEPEAQRQVTAAGCARVRAHRLHYAQALLLPKAGAQRDLLQQFGLRWLAPLVYLQRDAKYPWVDPPAVSAAGWEAFTQQTYDEFASTLLATYEGSLDCPELTGLRPIHDVIAAHQASGRFDPNLWELLRVEGQAAGCLLLTRLAQTGGVEVVYMGVIPSFRRRGIGSVLLRRALQRCREAGARRLTLVVDDRNEPAKRLYRRFALKPVARRAAYFCLGSALCEQAEA